MINIDTMIRKEIENGYGDANAQAKVCQDRCNMVFNKE